MNGDFFAGGERVWGAYAPVRRASAPLEGISVSRLSQMVSEALRQEPRLRNVIVTAEVSGFKHHAASGHWYFTLKDEAAAISCVMFRQNNIRSALRPADGDQVTVAGYVDFYAQSGRIQLYVTEMKAAGQGSLYERFELLKRKLADEGLFDPGRKKLLPRVPGKVAVITSASGAALHDILNVSGGRSPWIPIVLVPSAVQGEGAGRELARAVEKAGRIPGAEAIIIARGGGSMEDLWCFNDEELARAIAACPLPVVSGVGHEVDYTICDFVADVRASTPSNAAEIVFPDREELRSALGSLRDALYRILSGQVYRLSLERMNLAARLNRLSPEKTVHTLRERTRQGRGRLETAMRNDLARRENLLRDLRTRLSAATEKTLRERELMLPQYRAAARYAAEKYLSAREAEARRLRTGLEAISPLGVLQRGYALVTDANGTVLPDAASAGSRREMRIRFRDGTVDAVRKERETDGGEL